MPRIITTLAALLLVLLPGVSNAAEPVDNTYEFVEGQHYATIEHPRDTRAGEDEVEVIEFFWYGCGHCYAVEPHVQQWLQDKPEAVRFLRVPATLNRGWLLHARAYYTAEQLGITEQMHEELFAAIHQRRDPLREVDDVAAVFETVAGVDRDTFDKSFESFGVGMKLKQADSLARAYQLRGVPTFVIGGKYITTANMAGSYEGVMQVVRYLAKRELAEDSSVATQ